MISFTLSFIALVIGYFVYGRIVERHFSPDFSRATPAAAHSDGVDFIKLPTWKVFMIQFLNIAGTGPIFGAIMGAKFGPAAYLWIVLGCIFAGGVHDYLCGMLSLRHDGAGVPEIVGRYLGRKARGGMLVFSVFLLLMVGVVFVFSPALILGQMCGAQPAVWVFAIFAYYILATMLPIDKVIGRIYPLFAFSLIFMAVALMAVLYIKMPQLPELWNGLHNMGTATDPSFTEQIFPCLFITIACGALSGFHATQSPLMARSIDSERLGRAVFYGASWGAGLWRRLRGPGVGVSGQRRVQHHLALFRLGQSVARRLCALGGHGIFCGKRAFVPHHALPPAIHDRSLLVLLLRVPANARPAAAHRLRPRLLPHRRHRRARGVLDERLCMVKGAFV